MGTTASQGKGYMIIFVLGMLGGGLLVALATKAIPKMMTQMMSGMMQNMMSQMGAKGCDPSEM